MTAKPLTAGEQLLFAQIEPVIPHPDGKPWPKCCASSGEAKDSSACQCFCKKPRNSTRSRFGFFMAGRRGDYWVERLQNVLNSGGRFMCCHRKTDDGYFRECAGWAAMKRKPRRIQ